MEKASFGFTAKTDVIEYDMYGFPVTETKGQFQFNDKGAGFKFHGDVTYAEGYETYGWLSGTFEEDGVIYLFEVYGVATV